MNLQHLVYEDGVIAVALVAPSAGSPLLSLAIRWLDAHSGHRERRDRFIVNAPIGAS